MALSCFNTQLRAGTILAIIDILAHSHDYICMAMHPLVKDCKVQPVFKFSPALRE